MITWEEAEEREELRYCPDDQEGAGTLVVVSHNRWGASWECPTCGQEHFVAEWGDEIPPTWIKAPKTEPVNDLREGPNWVRFGVTCLAMAVTWFAAAAGYTGDIPVWIGGLIVVLAAGACWTVEVAS